MFNKNFGEMSISGEHGGAVVSTLASQQNESGCDSQAWGHSEWSLRVFPVRGFTVVTTATASTHSLTV